MFSVQYFLRYFLTRLLQTGVWWSTSKEHRAIWGRGPTKIRSLFISADQRLQSPLSGAALLGINDHNLICVLMTETEKPVLSKTIIVVITLWSGRRLSEGEFSVLTWQAESYLHLLELLRLGGRQPEGEEKERYQADFHLGSVWGSSVCESHKDNTGFIHFSERILNCQHICTGTWKMS